MNGFAEVFWFFFVLLAGSVSACLAVCALLAAPIFLFQVASEYRSERAERETRSRRRRLAAALGDVAYRWNVFS